MTTLLWTYGVWLCMLGPGGGAAPGMDLTRLVKDVQPAVVTILAYDEGGRLVCQGSGFSAGEKGHVITCYHVLEGAYSAEVKGFDGRRYRVSSVLATDKKADLVKVLVDSGGGTIRQAEVEGTMPSLAERIVVIGSPLGLEQTVSEGIVSGIRAESPKGKSFQISASTSKGSSGGPVLNMQGKVIGVVSSQAIEGQNLNFAVSAEQVLALIEAKEQKQNLEPASSVLVAAGGGGLLGQGRSLLLEGQYERALIYLRGISQDSANFRQALLLSGICYSKLGLNRDAVRVYDQAVRLDPASAEVLLSLGLSYTAVSQYKKATEAYSRAMQIAPGRADVRLCLGMAWSQAGEHALAVEAYAGAIRIDGACADAYYGMGLAQYKLGNFEAAVAAYRRVLELQPEDAATRFGLGLTLAALGRKEMALEQYAVLKGREQKLAARLLAVVGK